MTALLPDGSRDVALVLADGSTETVPLVDNVAIAYADDPPDSLTWRTPGGEDVSARIPFGRLSATLRAADRYRTMTPKPLALVLLAAALVLSVPTDAVGANATDDRATEAFSVFRHEARASDRIPARLRPPGSAAEQAGTRRIGGRAARTWMTVAGGEVCTLTALTTRGPASFGGCGPLGAFIRDGSASWTVIRGGTRVSAVVPNGFHGYRLVFADRVRRIKPRRNGFSIAVTKGEPVALTFVTADGTNQRVANPLRQVLPPTA